MERKFIMDTSGKTITCRAAIAWKTGSTLAIEEVQVDPPKAREVRIKMISTGICGTDDHAVKGLLSTHFPFIPGHEGAGIVESIGEGVSSVKPGDKVLTLAIPQCRECSSCLHPKGNFCEKQDVLPSSGLMLDKTSRFTCKGKKIYHFFRASTFTEYTVVPEIAVAKIDAAAPMDKVCIISCAVSTGYGAAVNSAKVTRGSTCVVFGLGGVGSAIVMGCKASGASRIIGVDINEEKFPWARALGVTDCLNPRNLKKPVQQVVMEMTRVGVDFAFEAIGLSDTMIAAWDSCHRSYGVCLIVGVASSNSQLSLNAPDIISGRTLKGVCLGVFQTIQSTSVPNAGEFKVYSATLAANLLDNYMHQPGILTPAFILPEEPLFLSIIDQQLQSINIPICTSFPMPSLCVYEYTEEEILGKDYKTRDCIPQLVTNYLQNKINIDPLITHQLPFDQLHKAFELYHAGKTIRCILLF